MNIVKFTNKVALLSVFLLMYWVFVFVCNSVFGFKIFRENITELFAFSVLGIMAILFAVIVLNVMYNLTAIAEGQQKTASSSQIKRPKLLAVGVISSFFVLFALMYWGDWATTQKKQQYLIDSATELLKEHQDIALRLTDFSYTKSYINTLKSDLRLLEKVEERFPQITIIALDEIDGKPILRGFYSNNYYDEDSVLLETNHILSTSSKERNYLYAALNNESSEHYFASYNGHYELYYPVKTKNGTIVMLLTKRSRYGKIGS